MYKLTKQEQDALAKARAEYGTEACCWCGRPGRSGDCFTGRVPFVEMGIRERCPSCGYKLEGVFEEYVEPD